MDNKTVRLRKARFWKYDGNHFEGRHWERYDPHNFGLGLIVAMFYWGEQNFLEVPLTPPLTLDDTKKIRIVHHKPDSSFGHEITVSAPSQVWEKGRQALEALDRLCAEE